MLGRRMEVAHVENAWHTRVLVRFDYRSMGMKTHTRTYPISIIHYVDRSIVESNALLSGL